MEAAGQVRILGRRGLEGRTGVVSIQTLTEDLARAAFRLDRDMAGVAYELDSAWGIMTRVGLHCAPSAHKTLGTFPAGTIRFSFGWWNTAEDVAAALEALEKILDRPER